MHRQNGYARAAGRRLYYELWGSGFPTVVYEPGSTSPGTETDPSKPNPGWAPIRDAIIAAGCSVLLYDRAGLGRSDPAPLPRRLADFTAGLRAMLQAAGVQPPVVLVGGSFGGMLALNYASLHPSEVAGVLLVDSTHPEHNPRALSVLPPVSPEEPGALRRFRDLLNAELYTPLETNEAEGLDLITAAQEARAGWNLGSLPLIVLTAGLDEWEEGFPMEAAERYEQVWFDLQKEMAALSTRSCQEIVADSDHLIHEKRPDVVIAAIRELAAEMYYNNAQPYEGA